MQGEGAAILADVAEVVDDAHADGDGEAIGIGAAVVVGRRPGVRRAAGVPASCVDVDRPELAVERRGETVAARLHDEVALGRLHARRHLEHVAERRGAVGGDAAAHDERRRASGSTVANQSGDCHRRLGRNLPGGDAQHGGVGVEAAVAEVLVEAGDRAEALAACDARHAGWWSSSSAAAAAGRRCARRS